MSQQTAASGNTVRVHYSGRLNTGQEFDSSNDRGPMEFTLGEGQVIKGFDFAVSGMTIGQEKTVLVPTEEAYGERRDDLVVSIPLGDLPDDFEPAVGSRVQMRSRDDQVFPVKVVDVNDQSMVVDANHDLAGEDLIFDITLVEIVD